MNIKALNKLACRSVFFRAECLVYTGVLPTYTETTLRESTCHPLTPTRTTALPYMVMSEGKTQLWLGNCLL